MSSGRKQQAVCNATQATVKLGKDGGFDVSLTIETEVTPDARALAQFTGRDIVMKDAIGSGNAAWNGTIKSVTTKPHAERESGVVAVAKVSCAGGLESLVGKQLIVVAAQEKLPGTE